LQAEAPGPNHLSQDLAGRGTGPNQLMEVSSRAG